MRLYMVELNYRNKVILCKLNGISFAVESCDWVPHPNTLTTKKNKKKKIKEKILLTQWVTKLFLQKKICNVVLLSNITITVHIEIGNHEQIGIGNI